MEKIAIDEQAIRNPTIELEASDTELVVDKELYLDEPWGDELYTLVASNEDVIIVCPWMGGAEVTLGDAMTTYEYPSNLNAEDEPFLISVVYGLLASRVIEEEELEELVLEAEEELIVDKHEAELGEGEERLSKEPSLAMLGGEFAQDKEKLVTPKNPLQPIKPLVYAKESSHFQDEGRVMATRLNAHAGGEHTQFSKPAEQQETSESALSRVEVAAKKHRVILGDKKVETPEVIAMPGNNKVAELIRPEAEVDGEIPDFFNKTLPVEIFAESVYEPQTIATESPAALPEGVTLSIVRSNSANEHQLPVINSYAELSNNEPQESNEQDIATTVHAEISAYESIDGDSALNEQTVTQEDGPIWIDMDISAIELSAEINVAVEQILAEYTQEEDEGITEVADRYLDKMIKAAVKDQVSRCEEDSLDIAKSTEELEDLFRDIFVEIDVIYSPEVIEHLARYTIALRTARSRKFEDEEADDMQKSGMSAIPKRSSAGHVTLNDTIIDARLISRVALESCGFKASLSLS